MDVRNPVGEHTSLAVFETDVPNRKVRFERTSQKYAYWLVTGPPDKFAHAVEKLNEMAKQESQGHPDIIERLSLQKAHEEMGSEVDGFVNGVCEEVECRLMRSGVSREYLAVR